MVKASTDRLECRLRISPNNQLEIVSSALCPTRLLSMIDPQDPHASRDALWVLWKLSHHKLVQQALCTVDGVATMLSCLHSDAQEVARYSLRVLYTLSFEQQAGHQIRQRDGVSTLLQCLEFDPTTGEDVERTRYALRTLCNIAADDQAEIGRLGGLGLVTDCMSTHDLSTMKDVLQLLCNLAADPVTCRAVMVHPGLLEVLQVQAESADDEAKQSALALLVRASAVPLCLQLLVRHSGLLRAVMSNLTHRRRRARVLACRIVCAMCQIPEAQAEVAAAGSPLLLLVKSEIETDGQPRPWST